MQSESLPALCEELLTKARASSSGRSAHTIHGGHELVLRQTVLALSAGFALGEHDSPGEATLQVLSGKVRLRAGDDAVEAFAGDFLPIPAARHDLAALEDSVVMLTVVADHVTLPQG